MATQMEVAMHDSIAICRSHLDMVRKAKLQEEHVAGRAWVHEWSGAGLAWGPSQMGKETKDCEKLGRLTVREPRRQKWFHAAQDSGAQARRGYICLCFIQSARLSGCCVTLSQWHRGRRLPMTFLCEQCCWAVI